MDKGNPSTAQSCPTIRGILMASKETKPKTLDLSLPIFQMKLTLDEIEPAIWRRIQTHNCSLADLHEIIQSCMGWEDEHMYAFEIGTDQYTDLGRGAESCAFKDSRSVRLSDLVEQGDTCFAYEYDFGDSWRHTIELEGTLPAEKDVRYPRCVDGSRACPPEDCGGIYGYYECLEASVNPDKQEYDERLHWLGDDFDPEHFSTDEVNQELLRVRRWIGQHPQLHEASARFSVGDRIHAKRGVAHSQYPDIPLGGWVGTVAEIAWLVPIGYTVYWTEETLAAAHPVYAKRCRRDGFEPETCWLDEGEMEADSVGQPIELEQPTNLVVTPLSAEDQDDRVRMVFGLTSDDPLPEVSDEAIRQYLDYLKPRLAFPFEAQYWPELTQCPNANKLGTVVGFASPSPIDTIRGLLCEVLDEDITEQVALTNLELAEDDPNCQYVDDYQYWLWDAQPLADEEEEYFSDDDNDDEEEDASWGDSEEEGDQENFGPRLFGDFDNQASGPQPFRREQPPVGRNDPCPCGSGKKFKKCCLKKDNKGTTE